MRQAIPLLSSSHRFDMEEAYGIQEAWMAYKQKAGDRLIGYKMGLTSPAKMRQMNVSEPVYGKLLASMLAENGERLSHASFIHPRVEAEVAFLLGKDLNGEDLTEKDVLEATDHLVAAIEIIDSRYENFRFTLADVIADNASSSKFVLGHRLVSTKKEDVATFGMALRINGELKATGTPANVLGHPARSVAMLAKMLARKGERLKAGDIVLAGGITEAIAVQPGDVVQASFAHLGGVEVLFV
ncbi:2-keto-4-pentenoate hydratase [Geobacillus sp. LEMMY01]|nr:fumarylacetoacetate hydrolase family protein [Geobacillus sp. LEMMY01]